MSLNPCWLGSLGFGQQWCSVRVISVVDSGSRPQGATLHSFGSTAALTDYSFLRSQLTIGPTKSIPRHEQTSIDKVIVMRVSFVRSLSRCWS